MALSHHFGLSWPEYVNPRLNLSPCHALFLPPCRVDLHNLNNALALALALALVLTLTVSLAFCYRQLMGDEGVDPHPVQGAPLLTRPAARQFQFRCCGETTASAAAVLR